MERKQRRSIQRRKGRAAMAVLLSFLLLFQSNVAFATTGTVSKNETAGEEAIAAVSENQPSENEEAQAGEETELESEEKPEATEEIPSEDEEDSIEDTVSGQTLPEIQAGAVTGPANPVHHCTKKDDGSDYTDFSYIYFGSYPQSNVTDSATIAAIDKAIIATFGETAEQGTDVWVNGIKYRRIRKSDTNYDGYFDDVPNDEYRYFKWERIKWKVLKNDGNTLFVVADKAIDCKDYNEVYTDVTWETSTIRNWLNTSFYHTAFNSSEQSAMAANEKNSEYGTAGGNDKNDKVYLLSIGEVTNEGYGFCSDYTVESMSRRMKASDYANARGVLRASSNSCKGNCYWWLRSPGGSSHYAAGVDDYGDVSRDGESVNYGVEGICPALHINLSSNIWTTIDDGTSGNGGDEKAAIPTASLPTKSSVEKNTKLTLSCATAGASIYYTTDGTIPTTASILYTGEITIDCNMTIKAVAVCRGCQPSDVAEFSYKLKNSGSKKVQKLTIKAPSKKLAAGTKVKLTLKVTPQNAVNKAVKWKSSNKKYITVDKNGKITLKKAGAGKTVTITATAQDGSSKKATIKIKIMKHAAKSIKLKASKKILKAGKTMTIKATVKTTGKNANKSLKWTSSNKKYATVNSKGKVTAKKAGKGKTVAITAKSTDGSNKKATVRIKIK